MNVVFIGASRFGLRCLQETNNLVNSSIEVVGVITAPEKFSISYRPEGVVNVLHADVGSYCESVNIPYRTITTGMHEAALFQQISNWRPDFFVVVGWYHMLPKQWLELAPAYGLHASLLPDYSGGAPLVWAIINGEIKTGITFFQFDSGVDSGPIVGQSATLIHDSDTIATLYKRIEESGINLINTYLPRLADGSARLLRQDESKRKIYPQRSPEDGLINWFLPAQSIYNFIRAQTRPYPGAYTYLNSKKITIWHSEVKKNVDSEFKPGTIQFRGATVNIICGDGKALKILDISENDKNIDLFTWTSTNQISQKGFDCSFLDNYRD